LLIKARNESSQLVPIIYSLRLSRQLFLSQTVTITDAMSMTIHTHDSRALIGRSTSWLDEPVYYLVVWTV